MVKMVEPKLNGGTHMYVYVEISYNKEPSVDWIPRFILQCC
jgi:hypothetical protein